MATPTPKIPPFPLFLQLEGSITDNTLEFLSKYVVPSYAGENIQIVDFDSTDPDNIKNLVDIFSDVPTGTVKLENILGHKFAINLIDGSAIGLPDYDSCVLEINTITKALDYITFKYSGSNDCLFFTVLTDGLPYTIDEALFDPGLINTLAMITGRGNDDVYPMNGLLIGAFLNNTESPCNLDTETVDLIIQIPDMLLSLVATGHEITPPNNTLPVDAISLRLDVYRITLFVSSPEDEGYIHFEDIGDGTYVEEVWGLNDLEYWSEHYPDWFEPKPVGLEATKRNPIRVF